MTRVVGRWTFFTRKDFNSLSPAVTPPASTTKGSELAFRRIENRIFDRGQFTFEHDDPDSKAPRHNNWRPFRLTVGGALLAFVALRNRKELGCLEVDACYAADGPGFPHQSAWRAVLGFVLAEASKRCPMIAASFLDKIPQPIVGLAGALGVSLPHQDRQAIGPHEGAQLLWKLAELPPALRLAAEQRTAQSRCSLGRLAYLLHAGIWSASEFGAALAWIPDADWVLASWPDASPLLDRVRIHYARHIVLASLCDALLNTRPISATTNGHATVLPESDPPAFQELASRPGFVREYHLQRDSDWPEEALHVPAARLTAGTTLRADFIAHGAARLGAVTSSGEWLRGGADAKADKAIRVLVVPNDFRQSSQSRQREILAALQNANVALLIAPVSVAELNGRVAEKFTRMQSVRP